MTPAETQAVPARRDKPQAVLVLGGGLAGIAAAVRLAQAGRAVTLVETSRRLGGRATSHDDPETGETLDNCQHVVMGCCTNLLDLYERMGVDRDIRWHSRLRFLDKRGRVDSLEASIHWDAPLHLAGSLLRMRTLTIRERLAVSRAMLAMLRIGPRKRAELDTVCFSRWLEEHRQPRGAIDKFWSVVIVSALNRHPDFASAAAAIHVFQDGFLAHEQAYLMGTATVPLRNLYDPATPIIESAGGSVMMGASVKRIIFDGARVTGVELSDGSRLSADWILSALPFDRLDKVVGDPLRAADPRLQSLDRFTHSPILGIHLWFDGPVTDWDHMIFVDSPLQWVFNKRGTRNAERGTDLEVPSSEFRVPSYLHCVISAADEWVDKSQEEIVSMALHELTAYLKEGQKPFLRSTQGPIRKRASDPLLPPLLRARVIKEKRATFAVDPGLDAIRPTTRGAVANLLLAGDWIATGWPATMEGAVRSGYMAASAIDPTIQLVPDLSRAFLCWLLARG